MMRKSSAALAVVLMSQCVAACETGGQQVNPATFGPVTTKMKKCLVDGVRKDVPADRVKAIVKIRLPKRLVLNSIIRNVIYQKISEDPILVDDPANDGTGTPDDLAPPKVPQPFHIYLKPMQMPAQDFIAVKVIIPADSEYGFYDMGGIRGVGLGDATMDKLLCGNRFKPPSGASKRQVAVFYVDLSQPLPIDGAAFNIGVVPDQHQDTPIFIDPKVRNDG